MPVAERLLLLFLTALGMAGVLYFGWWWFQPERVSYWPLYTLLTISIWFFIIRYTCYWPVLWNIQPHKHYRPKNNLTVDAFTTAAPGEPIEMTKASLMALKRMYYPHETYLLDDSKNPLLQAFCKEESIHYIARHDKKDAKCGNVNNGLRQSKGEFILIIDPDHIVEPYYLDYVLGHFNDPRVGFVQTAQAYYNQPESFVAEGGAEQTYLFYGPIMRGMASLGANPVIGTNCTFRRKALESIGLYKPGLAEDLHTSMALHSKGWEGRYVPQILARGLTPGDLASFCHQQLKWSRGVLELLINNFAHYAKGWTWKQRGIYALSMSYYFESVMILINMLIPLIFLLTHQVPAHTTFQSFAWHIAPWVLAATGWFFYSQRWLCDPKERGLMLKGMFLQYLCFPFHLQGIYYALIGKAIPYIPTAKTSVSNVPWVLVSPQMALSCVTLLSIALSVFNSTEATANGMLVFALWNAFSIFSAIFWCFEEKLRTYADFAWEQMRATRLSFTALLQRKPAELQVRQ